LAALELKTSRVIGQLHRRQDYHEFRQFWDAIEAQVPADLETFDCRRLRHPQNRAHQEMVRNAPSI
jgi:hypothetical protein